MSIVSTDVQFVVIQWRSEGAGGTSVTGRRARRARFLDKDEWRNFEFLPQQDLKNGP